MFKIMFGLAVILGGGEKIKSNVFGFFFSGKQVKLQ